MHPVLRAFRHRNYRIYWSGFAFSLIGTWMQSLALSWLVWRLTGSPFWLGVVGAMPWLPSLILGSIGGVIVDRTVKRGLLIITQLGLACCSAVLGIITISGIVQVEHVVLIAALTGLFTAVDTPARLSFVTELVGKEDIGNAVALNSTTFNGTRLIGPAIAGLLVPIIGEGGIFVINAVSFLAMITGLSMMRPPEGGWERSTAGGQSVSAQWREAWHYVRTNLVARTLILNVVATSILGFSYVSLMPVFADEILHKGVRGLGVLMGAVGVGAFLGGIWQAAFPGNAKRGRIVVFGAVGLCVGLILFSLSRSFVLSMLSLPIVGWSGISMLASTNTLLQTHSPDHLRGRVLGFYTTAFMGFLPFGSLLAGSAADRFGAPLTLGTSATVMLLIAFWTLARNPHLKEV